MAGPGQSGWARSFGATNTKPEQRFAPTRREFVRGAIVAGSALALPGFLAPTVSDAAPMPKRGGRLRVGVVGGGASERIDPNKGSTLAEAARKMAIYEGLSTYAPNGRVVPMLAESIEPNNTAAVWTVKLKSGIRWHDGKPLTSDDVIWTLRRNLDPKQGLVTTSAINMIDPNGIQKIDNLTVQFKLLFPYVFIPETFANRQLNMFQNGVTDFTTPAPGTGPFKYKSFTPGLESLFVRNDDYWAGQGRPYIDELQVLSISDPGARLNALLSGQLDAIHDPSLAQAKAVAAGSTKIKINNSRTGRWVPITLSVISKPFDDVRVRQALRLIVDRPQMVTQALHGFGFVGNDLFSPFDPDYASDFPQRHQDIEQAKFLLKRAGQSDLAFEIFSSEAGIGMLESALLFAEQAKKAGVTVAVKKAPADSYYRNYLKVPVAQSDWANRNLSVQIAVSLSCKAVSNETHWCRPLFEERAQKASQTLDPIKRKTLFREIQTILYEQGGNIIWGFADWVDVYSSQIHGYVQHVAQPLNNWSFRDVWIA